MRRSLLLFPIAVILLVGNSAQAQQESGTIIVIRASPDHAVVAADSRASRLDMRRGEIVDDHKCKLLSFGDRLVFVASGYDARFTRDNSKLLWSTFDEAKNRNSACRVRRDWTRPLLLRRRGRKKCGPF